jgi:hypothetical protein
MPVPPQPNIKTIASAKRIPAFLLPGPGDAIKNIPSVASTVN